MADHIVDILFVTFLGPVLIFVVVYSIIYSRAQLSPLLSIIQGRVILKFGRRLYHLLEGTWNGIKVQVEIKVEGGRHDNYDNFFITFFDSCRCPVSFKVRPTTVLFARPDKPIDSLADGYLFKIPQTEFIVYCCQSDETLVRQYLNPARLAIIGTIFSHNLNYFQVYADQISQGYLKIGVEGFRLSNSDKACKAVIQPRIVGHILEHLRNFATVTQQPLVETSVISSPVGVSG